MHKLAIPCLVMAAINIFVGAQSLFLAKMNRGTREYLPFALLTFGVAFYDIASIGLYDSLSIFEGIFWQRLQVASIPVITIFLIWFSQILVGQEKNRILKALIVTSSLMCVANAGPYGPLTLSTQNPAIKHISLSYLPSITYYEVELGKLLEIQIMLAVASYLYVCYLFLKRYLESRETTLLLIVAGQIIYFIGVLNDSLVGLGIYENIYINEYAFFFLVMAMTALLLSRYVHAMQAIEELNNNLERKVGQRTAEIEKLNEELQYMVDYDALTGVYNRRYFDKYFESEIDKAIDLVDNRPQEDRCREGCSQSSKHNASQLKDNAVSFGLAFIDLDRFKYINDNFGHPVGDRILTEVVSVIRNNTSDKDTLCRYGGDEFALLMKRNSRDEIYKTIENVRKEMETTRFRFDDDHREEQLTMSIGVVDFSEVTNLKSNEILKTADDRLLRAKFFGRNLVVGSSELPEELGLAG